MINKATRLQYNSERSILNGVTYKVLKVGKVNVTLEPEYSTKLIGLPTFRQPFNIRLADLLKAIEQNIYSII